MFVMHLSILSLLKIILNMICVFFIFLFFLLSFSKLFYFIFIFTFLHIAFLDSLMDHTRGILGFIGNV